MVLGGDGHAGRLKAAFMVTNTGADGDTLEVNDSAGTDGVSLSVSSTGVTGGPINVALAGDGFGQLTVQTGAGGDTLALSGFIAALTVMSQPETRRARPGSAPRNRSEPKFPKKEGGGRNAKNNGIKHGNTLTKNTPFFDFPAFGLPNRISPVPDSPLLIEAPNTTGRPQG